MDSADQTQESPRWFPAAAIAVLLWEMFGCFTYVIHVSSDVATIPAEQRAMWEATPVWSVGAYAVAVWVGLAGAIFMLMRRRIAEPLLLVSFLAVLVQFSSLVLVPALRDVTPASAWLLPIFIVVVCFAIWQFARHSRQRGWLR